MLRRIQNRILRILLSRTSGRLQDNLVSAGHVRYRTDQGGEYRFASFIAIVPATRDRPINSFPSRFSVQYRAAWPRHFGTLSAAAFTALRFMLVPAKNGGSVSRAFSCLAQSITIAYTWN